MSEELKQTPLHSFHVSQSANMAAFGGYHMPLWYRSGVKNEHLSVLRAAGLFDTSHMAVIMVFGGEDAFHLLQFLFSRNLNACLDRGQKPLQPGRCVYGVFLDRAGWCIDDAIVYQIATDHYMIVVNAGMGGKIAAHLRNYQQSQTITIADLTDQAGKIDLQGPRSPNLLKTILKNPEMVLKDLPYFGFKGSFRSDLPASEDVRLTDGTPILLSRTGYTGELGFELFTSPESLQRVWDILIEAGNDAGLLPCGLGARDSLRTGAMLPLSHQDIGAWPFICNPWEFALPYTPDKTGFTKTFLGAEALLAITEPEYTLPFVGYDLRKVSLPAEVYDAENRKIGIVLTCVTEMSMDRIEKQMVSVASPHLPEGFEPKGLSCGFIKVKTRLTTGSIVELRDNRRKIQVEITQDIRPDRTALKNLFV